MHVAPASASIVLSVVQVPRVGRVFHIPRHHGPTHNPTHDNPTHHGPRNHIPGPTQHSPRRHIPTQRTTKGGGVGMGNKAYGSRFICFRAIYTLQPTHNVHVHTHTRAHTHTPSHTYLQAFLIGLAYKNVLTNITKQRAERNLPNPNAKGKGRKEDG